MESLAIGLALVCAATGRAAAQASVSPPDPCAALATLELPGYALSEVKAQHVPAGPCAGGAGRTLRQDAARHTAVSTGLSMSRAAVDSKPYGIGFAVALPVELEWAIPVSGWRRAQRQRGCAARRTGTRVRRSALARGFAVASTDSGHQGRGVRRQLS